MDVRNRVCAGVMDARRHLRNALRAVSRPTPDLGECMTALYAAVVAVDVTHEAAAEAELEELAGGAVEGGRDTMSTHSKVIR